jgi:hypothetical protein
VPIKWIGCPAFACFRHIPPSKTYRTVALRWIILRKAGPVLLFATASTAVRVLKDVVA